MFSILNCFNFSNRNANFSFFPRNTAYDCITRVLIILLKNTTNDGIIIRVLMDFVWVLHVDIWDLACNWRMQIIIVKHHNTCFFLGLMMMVMMKMMMLMMVMILMILSLFPLILCLVFLLFFYFISMLLFSWLILFLLLNPIIFIIPFSFLILLPFLHFLPLILIIIDSHIGMPVMCFSINH